MPAALISPQVTKGAATVGKNFYSMVYAGLADNRGDSYIAVLMGGTDFGGGITSRADGGGGGY